MVFRLKELRSGVHSLLDLFEEFDHEICFGGSRPLLTGSSVVGSKPFIILTFHCVVFLSFKYC